MKNVVGPPVEEDDFFDRKSEFVRYVREILNLANILLVAPRRVGKTSFVLKLCQILATPEQDPEIEEALRDARLLKPLEKLNVSTAFLNVEACHDELDFAERLVAKLQGAGLKPGLLERTESAFRRFRQIVGLRKVGGVGVDMELSDASELEGMTLGRILEGLLKGIEESEEERTIVIAVDELPELLLALARQDNGDQRVEQFLHWLRAMRQTYRNRVRWIFLGSIGLDTFVDQRGIRKTINELSMMTLGAYSPEIADRFLMRLSESVGLEIDADVRAEILRQVGWPLPYHLQLMIHALVELKSEPPCPPDPDRHVVSAEDVGNALNHLLRPAGFGNFDTWRQRLKDQFNKTDYDACQKILKLLCQHAPGRTRVELLAELMQGFNPPDPAETEHRLSDLLAILSRDGYLIESNGLYAFRSFLLREYWYRREVL